MVSMQSCRKMLEFTDDEVEPYAVLVGKPNTADSVLSISVSRSRFFLDEGHPFDIVSDASVIVNVNGADHVAVYSGTGNNRYQVPLALHPGDSVSVRALVPGFDEPVTATTILPASPRVEVLDYALDTSGIYTLYRDTNLRCGTYYGKVRFKVHSVSDEDYYSLRIMTSVQYETLGDSVFLWKKDPSSFVCQSYITTNDPVVSNSESLDMIDILDMDVEPNYFYGREMMVRGDLFQGGEHVFDIEFQFGDYSGRPRGLDPTERPIYIAISSLSKDLYLYKLTLGKQSDLDLFNEPVQVHCNIQGGIGIFAGASTDKVYLVNPEVRQLNNDGDSYYKK